MTSLLAGVAVVLIAMSLYGVLLPLRLAAVMRRFMDGPGATGAALIRIALAGLLWYSAGAARTPVTFRVLAVAMLLAAVALPFIGTPRLARLIERVSAWPPMLIRLACLFGAAFGAFLLWAAWPGLFLSA